MKIRMLHGIERNLFGQRDAKQYGTITPAEIEACLPGVRASVPATKATKK